MDPKEDFVGRELLITHSQNPNVPVYIVMIGVGGILHIGGVILTVLSVMGELG